MNLKNVTSFKTESGLEITRDDAGVEIANGTLNVAVNLKPADVAALVTAAKAWGLTKKPA